jgi:propanol-preferring alcohol dehydrogenase
MCSGLTAYAALKRHTSRPERSPVLLIGLGGVGMMGLAIARALCAMPLIVADVDGEKRGLLGGNFSTAPRCSGSWR